MSQPHVIVVGAGPVGCLTSAVLATRGIRVTLLEAAKALPKELRASTFHPATLDLLEPYGVVSELVARGLIAQRFAYRERRGGVVAEFDLATIADATNHPYRLQCEQYKLCEVLLQQLSLHEHFTVHFDSKVVAITNGDKPEVRLLSGESLNADAIVGTDGAASAVRKSLGLSFEGMTYEDRYLVLSTTVDFADYLEDLVYVNYISDPDEWLVLLRTRSYWRALFPVAQDESDEDALAELSAQRRLSSVMDLPQPYDIRHRTIYRVHQRVADKFCVGRVLLLGDAAHINNPLGGMGMNGGLHDAILLGASLGAFLFGDLDETRLHSHAGLRRQIAINYVKQHSHENATSLASPDSAARRRALKLMTARANDPDLNRAYLFQASMIDAVAMMKDELAEVGVSAN